ncbi:hypothetical protein BN946_scf184534.g3 [Trametes cinnabarina]|uniref:DUF6532 domain-containing protein n=1 Tax=Pycnoporus cinnabarinus TaxID=5643 RepID=A0A060SZ64_PYCCI|nr:hypothetical protein BN946_scf184534.g3 [Trametes cinnabarina]
MRPSQETNGQQLREYNITPLSQIRGVGQIPEQRVDYQTQATPQPRKDDSRAYPGCFQDLYSDDDNGPEVFDDYVAHPHALLGAQMYGSAASRTDESMREPSPEAGARTVYDNDYEDEPEPWHSSDRSPSFRQCSSSPSVVSYAGTRQDSHMPSSSAIRPVVAALSRRALTSQLLQLDEQESSRKVRRIVEPREGRHCARKGDYEPEAQEILCEAVVLFKSYVCSQDAYPNKLTEKTWAVEAWQCAAAMLSIQMAPDHEILTVVAKYSWNLRGEVKTTARALVQGAFGFKTGLSPSSRVFNQERTAFLKRGRAFVYEIIGETMEDHVGLYEAEIIQDVVNRIFYKSPTDDGIKVADVYTPFPFVGLALVLMAIECCIDEWESGVFCKVTFSEENYSAIYQRHLQEMRSFEAESGADRILTEICNQITSRGR